jgi:hypothetical protein
MPAELLCTPINGAFELLAQPFVGHSGALINSLQAQELAFMSSWGDRGIAHVNISRFIVPQCLESDVKGAIDFFGSRQLLTGPFNALQATVI